jgi:hypothetical protein
MGVAVCMGATMMCSFGVAPASLIVIPSTTMLTPAVPSANTSHFAPVVNVPPFGMCTSAANPTVAAATAAALGVLTPMPCVPATAAPWMPGVATVLNGSMPIVNNSCTLLCSWGGSISVLSPGQTKVMV